MKPATAAVHAALWAKTDRQAALFVIAAAQQRLFTPQQFAEEAVKVKRDRRRRLLHALHDDIAGGIEAMGERDFAKLCGEWRLPEPTRQSVRRTENGDLIFDNAWDDYDLDVEIDGSHHLDIEQWMGDALKQNVVSLEGRTVLRIPGIALRVNPKPYMEQVVAGLRKGGWPGPGNDVRNIERYGSRRFGRPGARGRRSA